MFAAGGARDVDNHQPGQHQVPDVPRAGRGHLGRPATLRCCHRVLRVRAAGTLPYPTLAVSVSGVQVCCKSSWLSLHLGFVHERGHLGAVTTACTSLQ